MQNQWPAWAREIATLYESDAASQFILYGNVNDRVMLPLESLGEKPSLGTLPDFLLKVLLPRFDVVLSYDLGNGIRVEKGGEVFTQWPAFKENSELPKNPRPATETLTHYFRYVANFSRLKGTSTRVGCIIKAAHLVAPSLQGSLNYDLNALAMLMRDWATDSLLASHQLATFLISDNLSDLHPLLVNNPQAAQIKVPLPSPDEITQAFTFLLPQFPKALNEYSNDVSCPATQLAGATLSSIQNLLKTTEHKSQTLTDNDLSRLKKELVERDCNGLIEFIESKKSLDDLHGLEKVKSWLRQDIALWKQNDVEALPKGYLLCGPVGTGKTYLVECLAGEAGVPVVKRKNFRDRWVGSTEGNLEKIFRLLQALGKCYVFIDEADQSLGRRNAGDGDSGVGGRVYGMIAEEMSKGANRGKIVWILASSRPDLIEVDLKRPGRVDVKIPIFPTTTPRESFDLIKALCKRRGLEIEDDSYRVLEPTLPNLLTPGAAEALSIKVYRQSRVENLSALDALKKSLADYQNPVPAETIANQIELAIREASDLAFVPESLRK